MTWEPIWSAPKDRVVLLVGEDGEIGIGIHHWGNYWRFTGGDELELTSWSEPTHWHPLPELPEVLKYVRAPGVKLPLEAAPSKVPNPDQ